MSENVKGYVGRYVRLLQDVINVRRYVCKNVKMLKTLFERMLEVKVERMSIVSNVRKNVWKYI